MARILPANAPVESLQSFHIPGQPNQAYPHDSGQGFFCPDDGAGSPLFTWPKTTAIVLFECFPPIGIEIALPRKDTPEAKMPLSPRLAMI